MRMTPLEIQSQRFGNRLRGYDRDEVDAFLAMVTGDYESLMKENASLRQRISRLEKHNEELAEQEQLLKATLVSAQSMSEMIRGSAEKEREALLAEAEVRAEKILDASHRRAAHLAQDIREMKGLRSRLAETLRTSIETHLGLIKNLESDPTSDALVERMVEGRVAYLSNPRPPQARAVGERVAETHANGSTGPGRARTPSPGPGAPPA